MTANKETNLRCGMVSIVGRPNTGKSTLLNNILDEKVAIVSRIPQTTRNQIRGIYNDERGQIIFIDTPGVHSGRDKLDHFMNQTANGVIDDSDCVIYLVDTTRSIGEEEQRIANRLKDITTPLILGLNKVDIKSGERIPEYILFWESVKGKTVQDMKNFSLVALSGKEGVNVDQLIDVIYEFLPVGPALYDREIICDVPQRMAIADIVREKLLQVMRDELPHSLGVLVEDMRPVRGKTTMIKILILVERSTHKEIVVGKKGDVLKKIGTKAREELEELLETKVYLECFVKVKKNWRDDIGMLQELGYTS